MAIFPEGLNSRIVDQKEKRGPLNPKIVFLDIDGVLLRDHPAQSWMSFTSLILESTLIADPNSMYIQRLGKIFEQLSVDLKVDVAIQKWLKLWSFYEPLDRKKVVAAANRMAQVLISEEVKQTVQDLKKLGLEVVLISSTFHEFVRAVADILEIDIARSNFSFKYDGDGKVVGATYNQKEAVHKENQITLVTQLLGALPKNVIVVEDNPRTLNEVYPTVAVNPKKSSDQNWREIPKFLCPEDVLPFHETFPLQLLERVGL